MISHTFIFLTGHNFKINDLTLGNGFIGWPDFMPMMMFNSTVNLSACDLIAMWYLFTSANPQMGFFPYIVE
jgi:hypothetical protein